MTVLEQLKERERELKGQVLVLTDKDINLQRRYKELREQLNEVNEKLNKARERERGLLEEEKKVKEELEKVREELKGLKEKQGEIREKMIEIRKKIENEIKDTLEGVGARTLSDIERQIQRIETKLQTLPLSPNREKELIEKLRQLYALRVRIDETLNSNEEYKKLLEEMKRIRDQINDVRSKLREIKSRHREILREIRKVRREEIKPSVIRRREIIEELKHIREERLRVRKQLRDTEKTLKDLEKIIISLERRSSKRPRTMKVSEDLNRKAKEIFEKFLRGEKLTIEEIQILQAAGYI